MAAWSLRWSICRIAWPRSSCGAKLRQRFGGRLKALVSGGAALNEEIGLFFLALGVRLLQGYGQTEASPVVSVNPPRRIKIHTVGPALARRRGQDRRRTARSSCARKR